MSFSISEQIIHSTFQIFQLDQQRNVIGLGTGFIAAFCETDEHYIPSLVSNRHVLCACPNIKIVFTLRNLDGSPQIGRTVDVIISTDICIPHPNDSIDLAVVPLGNTFNQLKMRGIFPFYACVSAGLIPNKDTWEQFDAIEHVVTAGFPGGLRDTANNLPVVRSGITASHPKYNFQGNPEFLVDMPCFKGCSGSPVYLLENIIIFDKQNGNRPVEEKRILLLGVQFAIPLAKATAVLENAKEPSATVEFPLNLGYIIKSSELLAFEPLISVTATQ